MKRCHVHRATRTPRGGIMKKDKDAIMRQILGLLKELVDDGGAKLPTAPAANQPAGDTG